VLVADATSYRIVNAAAPGAPAGLRDAQFAQELESENGRVEDWRRWRLAAQAGLVAIPIAAILVLWKLGAAVPALASGASPAPGGAVTWIGLDPQYVARTRRHIVIAGWAIAMLHVAMAAMLAMAFATGKVAALGEMALTLAASPFLFYFVLRSAYRGLQDARLGASSTHLHVTAPGKFGVAVESTRLAKWSDVYFDGGRLLAGPEFVMVFHREGGWRYPQADFMREIAARIPSRNRVSVAALAWRSMRAGSSVGIVFALGFAAALAWLVWQLVTLL
jgi:hypothetical protein